MNRGTLRGRFGASLWLATTITLLALTSCVRKGGDEGSFQGNAEAYSGLKPKDGNYFWVDPRAICKNGSVVESGFRSVVQVSSQGVQVREACSSDKTSLNGNAVTLLNVVSASGATQIIQVANNTYDPIAADPGGVLTLNPSIQFTDTVARFSNSLGSWEVIVRAKGDINAMADAQAIISLRDPGVALTAPPSQIFNVDVSALQTDSSQRIFNGTNFQLTAVRSASGITATIAYTNGLKTINATTTDCQNTFLTPPPPAQSVPSAMISAGEEFSCATIGGSVYCWGEGSEGQLGDGNATDSPKPVRVLQGTDPTILASGRAHSCMMKDTMYCWGSNSKYQLGIKPDPFSATPRSAIPLINVTSIAAGAEHTCAVSNKKVFCWGSNFNMQLGASSATDKTDNPVQVTQLPDMVSVSAGSNHTCGLSTGGVVYCWGDNTSGQLGNPAGNNGSSVPVPVSGPTFTSIKSSSDYNCATDADSGVWCWGDNVNGTVDGEGGNAVPGIRTTPRLISTLNSGISKLALGPAAACGLKGTSMFCWGRNNNSIFGNGSASATMSPVGQATPSVVYQMAIGGNRGLSPASPYAHTILLTPEGLAGWGRNISGQVGDDSSIDRSSAVPIVP